MDSKKLINKIAVKLQFMVSRHAFTEFEVSSLSPLEPLHLGIVEINFFDIEEKDDFFRQVENP